MICGRPVPFVGRNAVKSVKSDNDTLRGFVLTLTGLVVFEIFGAVVKERDDPSKFTPRPVLLRKVFS